MGFATPDLPDVDPDEFLRKPLMERIHILNLDWAEQGFGAPRMVHCIYLFKLVVFYAIGGVSIAAATSRLPAFWHVGDWWNQPIIYQKVVIWTVLLEAMNVAGSWGPLAGKFKPMTGGILFWAKPGTIRERPFTWIPFTEGDRRTFVDVSLYVALLASFVVALVLPGVPTASLSIRLPHNTSGLVDPRLLIAPIVLLLVTGARDKIVFMGSRSEQYLPALVFFAVLSFTDMIIALKMLIVVVWIGAGVSKMTKHFSYVVPAMVSNTIWVPKWFRRAQYRNFPTDLRPSRVADFMAHVQGTFVEIAAPLVLFFSTNRTLTIVAALFMIGFHSFIVSTFPLAVPLEWNVLFIYTVVILYLGFPAWAGYYVTDMSSPWLTVGILIALVFFPILGNVRPDKVSFLVSLRQYSGNWATSLWAFAPGAEAKLDRVTRSAGNQIDQLIASGYEPNWAEVTLQRTIGFRSLHSHARGTFSVLLSRLPDIDSRSVREGEFLCNSLVGFNFGDGHWHGEQLVQAVQREAAFQPGELVVVVAESSSLIGDIQNYLLIDAALGVIERGSFKVSDEITEQPWLPNGPIPLTVTWSHDSDRHSPVGGMELRRTKPTDSFGVPA